MNDLQKHQIFIVDDSKVQLVLLEKVLKKEGFSVQSFEDGHNLLKSLKMSRPGLIISDIDMPRLNGFDLIEKVRNKVGETEIPFFMISANGDLAIQEKAEAYGAEVFLQKPFKYHVLIDVVRDLMDPFERAKT